MTPKFALHRSFLSWSGLMVISFQCWAWWYSMKACDSLFCPGFEFRSYKGGIAFERSPGGQHYGKWWYHFAARKGEAKLGPFPRPFLLYGGYDKIHPEELTFGLLKRDFPQNLRAYDRVFIAHKSPETWMVLVPYWIVIGMSASLWAILLMWWARRRKRRLAEFVSA